ncbi:MAG: hypothetical protein CVU99_06760 [Firmicutes bacterium HGW-Firmicutes-4]|jgi:hypothetical protein|nr:MAG: hypothetical protein CVU99_06760 [Firmicutes bacterium HGW-Firmicutes-4]
MAKKNFKGDNPAMAFITNPDTQEIQETQEEQVAQDTLNAQDVQLKQNAPSTQGRKGQKLPRINMAFSEVNLEYLQLMSRIQGVSMTAYVNNLIESDREKNTAVIERAKEILSGVKK